MSIDWLDVSSTTPRIGYTATASQTAFTVPFVFFANEDLVVYKNGVLLALDVDYSVTGAESESGGTVTLVTAAAASDAVMIYRDVAIETTTHIPPSGPLDIPALNIQISKLVAIDQQLADDFVRSIKLPDDEATTDQTVPALADRANKFAAWNSSGALIGSSGTPDTAVPVSTFMESLLGATSAAGLVGLLGLQITFLDSAAGVVGNGIADDRAAVQAAIDALSTAGGGVLWCGAGKTYRCVIAPAVTDQGLIMKPNVTLFLNNATFAIECTGGDVYGFRMQNDSHIQGPGTIGVTVSSGLGSSQSIYHSPICLGTAYGEVTSVGALGNYINATRWSIRRVKLTSVRTNGYHIVGLGGISHGVIEDIEFPSDATSIGCVNFDWGTVGNIDSSDVAGTRTRFDANTAYTVHPNNIDIRRLKIGTMSNASSTPIRLSGVHAIRIDGFEIVSCKAYGIFHTAGDLGYEFADSDTKRRRHSGIEIKNGLIQFATTGQAIYCDVYADNVAAAVGGGYSPALDPVNTTDIIFENIRSIGNLASNAGDGIQVRYMNGGTIRNCTLIGHQRGIFVDSSALHVRIEGGEINSCYQNGIYIGAGTVPEEITVDGVWCWSNGVGGAYSGIYAFNGKFHKIKNCRLGANSGGDSFQDIGIEVGSSCSGVHVTNNHVMAASTAAYKMSATGFYGSVGLFDGNTAESGVSTVFSGVEIICVKRDYSLGTQRRMWLMTRSVAATTPPTGTWVVGDTIEFSDPITTGYKGTVCTVAGTPGTWKNYGVIA